MKKNARPQATSPSRLASPDHHEPPGSASPSVRGIESPGVLLLAIAICPPIRTGTAVLPLAGREPLYERNGSTAPKGDTPRRAQPGWAIYRTTAPQSGLPVSG